MPCYLLSDWVHLRLTTEGAILLDLRRDEYLALTRNQADVLRTVVCGWPTTSGNDIGTPDSQSRNGCNVAAFVRTLLARGLVTTDITSGKPATQVELDPPTTAATIALNSPLLGNPVNHIASFLHAFLATSSSLRFRSLDRVIDKIERRKRSRASLTMEPSRAKELDPLLSAFISMRTLFYTPRDECLFDSLNLVNFLSAYGFFPKLVFGVRTDPFEAHAWVQDGICALNCPSEYARGFLPIMAI